MNISYTKEFKKLYRKLPIYVQRLYQKQEKRFCLNAHDARLHTKKLGGFSNLFSFRITRGWRVIYSFTDVTDAIMLSIGHRKDIYRR